ncbi:AI-2E family transporter, partial [Peptostreptococcus stomatis]|uniref:AI-2E family transporter n=1 Tax=Peptostreptococcus stomatis TaxID=341694 RepID=UPI003FA16278
MNSINFKRRIVFVSLVFGLTALVVLNIKDIYSLLDKIFTVLNPIILGCFIAFILNIIVENIEKRLLDKANTKLVRKLKRPISILLSLAFFLLIILLVSRIIIPQISKFIEVFTNSFPNIYNEIMKFLAGMSKEFPSLQSKLLASNLDAQAILKKLVSLSTTWAGDILNIINSVFSVIANIVIALIIAIYILAGKEGLKSQFTRLFATFIPQPILDKFYYLLR